MSLLIRCAGAFCVIALSMRLLGIAVTLARLRSPAPPLVEAAPPVTLVRPVSGLENYLESTLASSFALAWPQYEVLFCVAREADAAVPLIRRLMAQHSHVRAQLLIGNDAVSGNPKLNNVVKGWRAASHAWIAIVDSNLLLPTDYFRHLFAAWDDDAGLVSAPPIGTQPIGFWAELECAFLNGHQACWQSLADALGIGFAQGKTMLWRRELVEAVGGIAALGSEPAEDAAATKLVRRAGLRVRLARRLFAQPLGQRTRGQVWKRQLRWARLRRATFPLPFAGEILTGSVPPLLATAIVAIAAEWPLGPAIAAVATLWYGAEAVLTAFAGWPMSRWSPLQWVLRDLMLPMLWIAAMQGDEFEWRGHDLHLQDRVGSV